MAVISDNFESGVATQLELSKLDDAALLQWVTNPEAAEEYLRRKYGAERAYDPDEHLARRYNKAHDKLGKFASKAGGGAATHEQLELFPAPGIKVDGKEVPIVTAKYASPEKFDKMHDADVSEEEALAIKEYSGHGHEDINGYLRGDSGIGDWEGDTTEYEVEMIRSAIAKNTVKTDVMVTRRVRLDAFGVYEDDGHTNIEINRAMRGLEGSIVQDDGFLSTTIKRDPKPTTHYHDFPVEMRIRVPKGTHGVFMDTEATTNFPSEKELLLGDGTRLAVLRTGMEAERWILDMQVVP